MYFVSLIIPVLIFIITLPRYFFPLLFVISAPLTSSQHFFPLLPVNHTAISFYLEPRMSPQNETFPTCDLEVPRLNLRSKITFLIFLLVFSSISSKIMGFHRKATETHISTFFSLHRSVPLSFDAICHEILTSSSSSCS